MGTNSVPHAQRDGDLPDDDGYDHDPEHYVHVHVCGYVGLNDGVQPGNVENHDPPLTLHRKPWIRNKGS